MGLYAFINQLGRGFFSCQGLACNKRMKDSRQAFRLDYY